MKRSMTIVPSSYTSLGCHRSKTLSRFSASCYLLAPVGRFISFSKDLLFLSYMCGCFACMYFCAPHMCLVPPDRRGNGSPETSYRQCGCWEWNPGLLEEQPVFLTIKASLNRV